VAEETETVETEEASVETTEEAPVKETVETAPEKEEPAPWYGEVDDDLKKVATRLTSPADALRSIAAFQKREGQVRVPGKDATDEDWTKYYKAVGVPETPDKYQFPKIPEDQLTDEVKAVREHWAQVFHENKLSSSQAKALLAAVGKQEEARQKELDKADKEFAKQSEEALREEWGGEYGKNTRLAERAMNELGNRAGVKTNDLLQLQMSDGRYLMDDVRMLKLLATVGREMSEGTLGGAVTDDEREGVEEQIADIRKQVEEAQQQGNTKKANQLYQRQLALRATLTNNQPIVGNAGRAV